MKLISFWLRHDKLSFNYDTMIQYYFLNSTKYQWTRSPRSRCDEDDGSSFVINIRIVSIGEKFFHWYFFYDEKYTIQKNSTISEYKLTGSSSYCLNSFVGIKSYGDRLMKWSWFSLRYLCGRGSNFFKLLSCSSRVERRRFKNFCLSIVSKK